MSRLEAEVDAAQSARRERRVVRFGAPSRCLRIDEARHLQTSGAERVGDRVERLEEARHRQRQRVGGAEEDRSPPQRDRLAHEGAHAREVACELLGRPHAERLSIEVAERAGMEAAAFGQLGDERQVPIRGQHADVAIERGERRRVGAGGCGVEPGGGAERTSHDRVRPGEGGHCAAGAGRGAFDDLVPCGAVNRPPVSPAGRVGALFPRATAQPATPRAAVGPDAGTGGRRGPRTRPRCRRCSS